MMRQDEPLFRRAEPTAPRRLATFRAAFGSLPGRLLVFTVAFVLLAQLLIFLPLAGAYRTQWLWDRANAAAIAAEAADIAPAGALPDDRVRALLAGVDAVAIARTIDGRHELILYGGPVEGRLIIADLRHANPASGAAAAAGTMFAPPGRYLRIIAWYPVRPDVTIDVIVPEAPLKAALTAYSARLFWITFFIALVTGILIFVTLNYIFVRPMRRLAGAMTSFRDAPEDPRRLIVPSGRGDEIGEAEAALADMQAEIGHALKQRERLSALGSAVTRINHDLRNVLASAQIVSDRLAAADDPAVRRMGERLVRAIGRGIRLCEAVLVYGKAEEGAPQRARFALKAALDEAAADAMAAEGEAEWINRASAELTLDADPDQTHRIFLNLLRNALQAMEGRTSGRTMRASAAAADGFIDIEIADNGPGIAPKARERLFQPFAGARKGGTGLGLANARELARAHGGEVILLSTGPDGTVFRVRLPGDGEVNGE